MDSVEKALVDDLGMEEVSVDEDVYPQLNVDKVEKHWRKILKTSIIDSRWTLVIHSVKADGVLCFYATRWNGHENVFTNISIDSEASSQSIAKAYDATVDSLETQLRIILANELKGDNVA